MKRFLTFIIIAAVFAACKPDINQFTASKGDADFSRYVSLGNSITSGYTNGALYQSGQKYSYPSILAQQFKLVGGGDFKQPIVPNEVGVIDGNPNKLILGPSFDCTTGTYSLGPVPCTGTKASPAVAVGYHVNNLGVPGAKSFHLLAPGYGNIAGLFTTPITANPYYVRFASSTTSRVIDEVQYINPTFFTLWIGNNDVLQYALNGGSADSITSPSYFGQAIGATVQALTANGSKGAIATIPDVTSIPYFTTVPYNGLVLKDPAQVAGLNAAYSALGIQFHLGQNPFIMKDVTAPGQLRAMKPGELVLVTIPRDSICAGWGSMKPIPPQFILDLTEVNNLKTAVAAYNVIIANLAASKNLALVDMNSYLKSFQQGVYVNGVMYNSQFVTGGVFSLDGIHPTSRGNALIANYFIQAINTKYNSHIPMVNVNDYPGIAFP